jgi:putative Mg2+ transporter-C (MgtC) family protein
LENLSQELQWAVQLIATILLALPTAWNREAHSRTVGLRTFPLVSLGACAYVLIGHAFFGPDQTQELARIMQGLLTGIGFVGGGAILKGDDRVQGTTSAASIWITGALGAACGFQFWMLAVTLSALNFAVIFILDQIKPEIETSGDGKH